MRNSFASIVFSTVLFASPLYAGPGEDHDHGHSHGPISSQSAEKKAVKKVIQLVQQGKIDKSWADVRPRSVERKEFSNGPEWVITFENTKVGDPGKKKLYLFYTLDGHYLAANYTGN